MNSVQINGSKVEQGKDFLRVTQGENVITITPDGVNIKTKNVNKIMINGEEF